MSKAIIDTFIMPVDGQEHAISYETENLVVAIGSDGEFYAFNMRVAKNLDSLCKAVGFAGKVASAKVINTALWFQLPKEWVEASHPYVDFGKS